MWIIVEGATCSGKSTLIDALFELDKTWRTGTEQIHKDKPKDLTREYVLNDYVFSHESYQAGKDDIIADRWHWGEVTYSPIYRRDTNLDGFGLLGKAGWRWTEMFLASRGAVVALCRADNDTLVKRFADRGDDHVQDANELLKISAFYDIARRESITTTSVVDTSNDEISPERFKTYVEMLITSAKDREQDATELRDFPEYIGPIHPGTLLVGDAQNNNPARKVGGNTKLPFIPVNGNSSEFLLASLHDMFWREVGIINANDSDLDLYELWGKLGEPNVVALGKDAAGTLNVSGIPYQAVPHPSYVRRFHSGKRRDYGRAILNASNGEETAWKL